MVRTIRRWFMISVLPMLLVTPAWGAAISGTVSNSTGKSGRIYLAVNYQNGGSSNLGTSIASTVSGSFTINGVPPGTQCSVQAFVDTQGNGVRHANDPVGVSTTVTAGSGTTSVGSFAVATPAATAAQAPQAMVYPGNGGNFVIWDTPETNEGLPIADRYTVEWSTSPSGSPVAGSRVLPSGDMDFFAHPGASSSLYYRVSAQAGGSSASSPWVRGIPSAATGSVSGKVFFPGVTPSGPLLVALANESSSPPVIHLVVVSSPVSGASYSASNVPAGTYTVYPILDQNNNGAFDLGDLGPSGDEEFNAQVSVASGAASAADITLSAGNAATRVSTSHGKYQVDGQQYQWYNLQFSARSMLKRVVKVQVGSGPQVSGPIDVALDGNEFRTWLNVNRPTVGDSYPITLTYWDGTSESTETVTRSVTGVLDGFATPIAPVGFVPYGSGTPTFSWSQPNPAPAEYVQSLWMQQSNPFMNVWDVWGLAAGTTSLPYGSQGEVSQQTLSDGVSYNWTLNIRDRNGNESQSQANFTPTTAPAVSGFSPAGGLPGTTVTISGINFSTTPGQNTVTFNNVPATVTQASSTSLTVTVPANASTGLIKVTSGGKSGESESQFVVSAPVTVRGVIRTKAEAPIAGARVELADNPAVFTTTAADGSFTLQPLFQGQDFALKVTGSSYVTTYSTRFFLEGGNLDLTPYPFHLYTQADLTSWGVAAGNGAIFGRAFNSTTTPFAPVAGVQLSATISVPFAGTVPVSYFNGTSFGGSSTYANGLFFIANVGDFSTVAVDAAKDGWNFYRTYFEVRANSVTEGAVFGNFPNFPALGGFTPASGKAGASVTISGANFSATAAENVVKFNGAAGTVTSASPGTLIVTVPANAVTGPISVATPGGTVTSGSNFTMRHTLTTSVSGTNGGMGTVTSVPAGISCRNSGCTALFDQGTSVQLIATADGGSMLSAWSGACSGSGPCSFTLNADKTVAAAFDKLLYLKNGGSYYALLQEAFDGAANGSTIQAQAQTFSDTSLLFNRPGLQVKLKGGYDPSFLNSGGVTTLDGRLNLRGGTLRVERLKIK